MLLLPTTSQQQTDTSPTANDSRLVTRGTIAVALSNITGIQAERLLPGICNGLYIRERISQWLHSPRTRKHPLGEAMFYPESNQVGPYRVARFDRFDRPGLPCRQLRRRKRALL